MDHTRFIDDLSDILEIERRPYAESVPARTTFALIGRRAQADGEATALLYARSGDPGEPPLAWSYRQLRERIVRAANVLRALGVERDQPVALLAPNIPTAQAALWGAQLAGCAFPINHLLNPEHISQLLRAAGARVVVALGASGELPVLDGARESAARAGCVEHVLEIDPDEFSPGADSLQARMDRAPATLSFDPALTADSLAALYHTGGTTGLPKLLRHSHGNEAHTSWFASRFYRCAPGDVLLNGFPLFHVAGAFVYGLSTLAAGATLLLPTLTGMRNTGFVRNLWRFAERHRITHIGCVPTILAALIGVEPGEADRSSVRAALTGGSPLPTELAAQFERVHGIPVRNIFGMTECAGIVSIEPFGSPRTPGSTGMRLPYTEVAAIPLAQAGADTVERLCAPGEVGVMAIRGPHVSAGYLDPSRNAGTFTRDGWLISGDLGYVDDAQRIFLTGRSKDLIIRGGHNIDPGMIEEAFLAHPAVSTCAAVGEPDGYAGELPVVFLTLKPGAGVDADTVLREVAPRIAERPAVPKRAVVLEALPLTAIGKIYKPALRVRAAEAKLRELIAAAEPALRFELACREDKGGMAAELRLQDASAEQAERLRGLLGALPVSVTVVDQR